MSFMWSAIGRIFGRGPALSPGATPSAPRISAALLARLDVPDAADWTRVLDDSCRAFAITTRPRLAHFLATVLHESSDLTRLVENLNYSPDGLMRTWPHRFERDEAHRWGRIADRPADQRAIAERAYGGRMGNGPPGSGDGYTFRGRGLVQLTGRENYRAAAAGLGVPLSALPAWMETREGAARSAAWWWAAHGCNELADAGDTIALRRRVNGGVLGLDDVRVRHRKVLAALEA